MIRLVVNDVISKVSGDMVFAVMLKEKDGDRVLPVMVGLFEAQAIAMGLRKVKLPRPSVYDLYLASARSFDAWLQGVRIYKVHEGIFYSYLVFEKDGGTMMIDARTSDAVAIALRADAPIYIEEELLEKNAARKDSEGGLSMPIWAAPDSVLSAAMEKAIETENYEFAARIRDEFRNRRKKN